MSKIIVSLVSFNTRELLKNCLKDLQNQKTESAIEIWVLDNNSDDGSVEMLIKDFPKVKLIKEDKNLGFVGGQNKILNAAKGDYYLLLNPDTQIPLSAVEKQIKFMRENDCEIASCKMVGFDGGLQSNGGDLPFGLALLSWLFNLESFGVKANFHRQDRGYYNSPKQVGWVGGTFMMVKKEVFEKIGYLNKDYFMYVEDVEFCYRAQKKGFKIMINPDLEIKHISGASSKDPRFFQWKNEFKNLVLFYKQNLGIVPALFLQLLFFVSTFLRMVAFMILGKGGQAKAYGRILANI